MTERRARVFNVTIPLSVCKASNGLHSSLELISGSETTLKLLVVLIKVCFIETRRSQVLDSLDLLFIFLVACLYSIFLSFTGLRTLDHVHRDFSCDINNALLVALSLVLK